MNMTLHEKIAEIRREKKNSALVVLFYTYTSIPILWLCMLHPYVMQYPFLLCPLWFLLGVAQYYIVISGHEAVHKTLCYPLERNEFWGILGQSLVGVNFTAYRQQHIDHHKSSSYQEDPDAHIYMGVIRKKKGISRLLFLTLGTFIEIVIKIRQKGSGGIGSETRILNETIQKNMSRDSLFVIFAQLCIMFISQQILIQYLHFFDQSYPTFENGIVQNNWYINSRLWLEGIWGSFYPIFYILFSSIVGYALCWIIPLFCVTVFLNRCRIVIEHGLPLLQESNNKNTDNNLQDKEDKEDKDISFVTRRKKAEKYDITHYNKPWKRGNTKSTSYKNQSETPSKKGPKIPTIDIVAPKWQQIIFAPFSFNYHCTHHLFMGIPHYNLHKLHQLLREEEYQGFYYSEKGYLQSLQEIMQYEHISLQESTQKHSDVSK